MRKLKLPSLVLTLAFIVLVVLGTVFFFGENEKSAVPAPSKTTHKPAMAENKQNTSPQESFSSENSPSPKAPPGSTEPLRQRETLEQHAADKDRQSPPADPVEFEKWTVNKLKRQFGDRIQSKGRQAELLGLRRYIMEQFPQDWQSILNTILDGAFAQDADRILETFAEFDAYNQWFEDNASFLGSLDYETLKTQLTQKRSEIFGDAATEIPSFNSKATFLEDVLGILNHAENIPIDDQFYVYKNALDDAYPVGDQNAGSADAGNPFSSLDKSRTYHLTTAFVSMDSVQRELQNMDGDERAEKLYQIRREMGFDDAALDAMAREDSENDRKWQNGLKYMTQREELTNNYSGVELDTRLEALRKQYFNDQAQTIAAEESANFFRYNRKRVYGRN